MKKKLLSILSVAAVSAVALVGCGGDDHTHNYKWKFEGDKHWQECSCGDKKGEANHVDEKINATGAAGKDELCDVCGADLHEHVYQWNSTALVHWQECECGDKTAEAAHADEQNNETGAVGADEMCDACGRGFYAVTFNLDGHGAVATQYVGKDGKVVQPETPADDDAYKFEGWYKDAAHTTAYNFETETITSATEIYAWFKEDETPGASKKHAYELELEVGNAQKAQKDKVVYYAFTATEGGRYTLSLGMGTNNENATFTTTLTGETKYGKDCENAEVTVDVSKNQTVYILFTFLGEEGDDVAVSPLVTEVTNEPMPADYFLAGEYFNANYVLEITDRTDAEHQSLTFNGTPYTFRYIGGSFDRIYFIDSSSSLGEVTYYLSYKTGKYYFSSSNGGSASAVLEYYEVQEPVALGDIVGYYEPESTSGGGSGGGQGEITPKPEDPGKDPSDAAGGIIGLYIYDNTLPNATTVRLKTRTVLTTVTIAYGDLIQATYNTDKNRLSFDSYVATLKLGENGDVEGIVVGGVTFVRKGDAGAVPPQKLNDLEDGAEYVGETHTIRNEYGSQYFGATGYDRIYIMSYDDTTGVYTADVIVGSTSVMYKITVADGTIKLYQTDGTTLIDTLTKYEHVVTYKDIATDGKTTTLASEDFYHDFVYFKAKTAGWYKFTEIGEGIELYANMDEEDLENPYSGELIADGSTIYLEQDAIVAAYLISTSKGKDFVSETTEAPKGSSAENPIQCTGTTVVNSVNNKNYYFVEFTAPKAGKYEISAYSDAGWKSYVRFNINGEDYGYSNWAWIGGCSYEKPYTVVEATEGQKVLIKIDRIGAFGDPVDITVDIVEPESEKKNASTIYGGVLTDGSWNTAVTLTVDGTSAVYAFGGVEYKVSLELDGDKRAYTFSYTHEEEGFQTVSFTIADGGLSITDSFNGTGTLKKL